MHVDVLLVSATTAAGWLGQTCFFTRFLVQWIASERAHRPVVPRSFWWLSLAGAVMTSAYALYRGETLLLLGFVASGAIAARNLRLAGKRERSGARMAGLAALLLVGVLVWIELRLDPPAHDGRTRAWLLAGVVGQTLWSARFPLQWWLSERAGESLFPRAFWWLSIAGNLLLLAYALHLRDPVFVLGFLPGPFLQARNLVLAGRSARSA